MSEGLGSEEIDFSVIEVIEVSKVMEDAGTDARVSRRTAVAPDVSRGHRTREE